MLNGLKKILGLQKCFICHNKAEQPRYYLNDAGEKVPVCYKCVSYAERRALRKP
jgi:hypothetical protein